FAALARLLSHAALEARIRFERSDLVRVDRQQLRNHARYFIELELVVVDKREGIDSDVEAFGDVPDFLTLGQPVDLRVEEVLRDPELLQLLPCGIEIVLADDAEQNPALVQILQ